MTTKQRRQVVTRSLSAFSQSSARRACRLVSQSLTWQYRSVRGDDAALRVRLRELAAKKSRWGYQQLHELLHREGRVVNHKKVLRLYREEGLGGEPTPPEEAGRDRAGALPKPSARTERWSMDFVSDALFDGRPFRCFTLVDDFTRECPALEVAHSLPAWRVIHVLEGVAADRGLRRSIVCDNGPEFAKCAWVLATNDVQSNGRDPLPNFEDTRLGHILAPGGLAITGWLTRCDALLERRLRSLC